MIPDIQDRRLSSEGVYQNRVCREITPDDIDAILPWFENPDPDARQHLDFPFETIEEHGGWKSYLTDYYLGNQSTGYVVEENGTVLGVGGITYQELEYVPPHDRQTSAYIRGILVDRDHRGKRVGSALISTLVERAFHDERGSVYGWIMTDKQAGNWLPNYHALVGIGFRVSEYYPHWKDWEKLGYKPDGRDALLFRINREQYEEKAQSRAI